MMGTEIGRVKEEANKNGNRKTIFHSNSLRRKGTCREVPRHQRVRLHYQQTRVESGHVHYQYLTTDIHWYISSCTTSWFSLGEPILVDVWGLEAPTLEPYPN